MQAGDLVRLTDNRCYHPDDDFTFYGVLLKIERDYFGIGRGYINRDEGCHIRWDNGTTTVEPIQFIEKVHADVVKQVDTTDLKSVELVARTGSSPVIGTNYFNAWQHNGSALGC